MAYSPEEERTIMRYDQHGLHLPAQQKQQDIFDRLKEYRQQLTMWNQELADIEQWLMVFWEHQHVLQRQLEILHRERDYFFELREKDERKLQEWQQMHRHDANA
jgi:regulator of replication initiation timing